MQGVDHGARRSRTRYVRRQGEDACGRRPGARRRHPARAGASSACWPRSARDRVLVRPRPRVVVMSTGSELVEPGEPDRRAARSPTRTASCSPPRRPGRWRDAYRVGIVPDEPKQLITTIEDQLIRADLVITTGGVSVGAYDVVKEALGRLGTVDLRAGRDAAGHAAGVRAGRARQDTDLHPAGQPGVGLRLVRDVRASGAAADARGSSRCTARACGRC